MCNRAAADAVLTSSRVMASRFMTRRAARFSSVPRSDVHCRMRSQKTARGQLPGLAQPRSGTQRWMTKDVTFAFEA